MQYLNLRKKRTWLLLICGILVLALLLCIGLFGWGRGSLNIIDFSAEEVEYVKLSCAQLYPDRPAVIRDKAEIQSLIDSVNAFQNTGSTIKEIFMYGLFRGGSMLHTHTFVLSNGDVYSIIFSSSRGGQPVSDMNLSYWVDLPDGKQISGNTCRGSLETFYTLHKKYLGYD